MNNLNELKLMEAQINQIFQIIENAENREISKIAAETLANKCLDNAFTIFIIFKNFLEYSIKGKLRVFDDAGFLIDLILEEMDKNTIKKLFEAEYFKEFIKKIYEDNKIFYSLNITDYQLLPIDHINILNFNILNKINIENIEPLYSNKAEDWSNQNNESENRGESFGKMDLEILFPIKDDIKQEIEQCLNIDTKNKYNNFNNLNLKVKNPIGDFVNLNSEKINLKNLSEFILTEINFSKQPKEVENNKDNIQNNKTAEEINKFYLNKKKQRNNKDFIDDKNIIDNGENKIEITSKNMENNIKKRKIDNYNEQTKEKLEFYFNPLFFVVENIIKLNSNDLWRTRLCSISFLTLLNKFFDLFYYNFFKVTCNIFITKTFTEVIKKQKGNKKNYHKESLTEDINHNFSFEYLIEDIEIFQQNNLDNILSENQTNNNIDINNLNNPKNLSSINLKNNEEYYSLKLYEKENISISENFDLKQIFFNFEKKIKENLFTNLFINSLIDKVVDFDSEDYICIFKDLNLKLANKILEALENKTDQIQEENLKDLNKYIYLLLNKAIINNNTTSDWQPIFSILTFLKIKMIGTNENNSNQYNQNNNLQEENHEKTNFVSNYNKILSGKNSFFNFSSSQREFSIFSLIEDLMKIDSEEIINITIQILDKILERFNCENYNSEHINSSKDKMKIISIFKKFILLINNYDDIEVGVKYYFNCLHNFIIFFKNLSEKNSGLEDSVSKNIIENDLIFYALNKNKSVRIKYFNLITNILEGKLIYFDNHADFIQKNLLLGIQGLCLESNEEILNTQKNFIINIINSKEEACLDVFFNFSKFILKLILKMNIKETKYFYVPNNEKFMLCEMESFYSSFFVNDMQVDLIKSNYDRKIKHMIPIISNVMKNRIDFVRIIIKNLNIDFNEIKISKYLLIFLKIYYNYLDLIDEMENKTLIIPDNVLNLLIDNKKLDEFPVKISKKDLENNIGIAMKFFIDFLEKYISNNVYNTNGNQSNNFLEAEFNQIYLIYNNLINFRLIKISEVDDLLKVIFNKIKEFESENINNKDYNKYKESNKLELIYENFKIITNNLRKLDEDNLPLKIKIRAYASLCLFNHSIYSNVKFDKISIFVNPILNCLKINSKESKIFSKNLINMIFNHTTNLDSRNKIINIFIDNCLTSYSDDINNVNSSLNGTITGNLINNSSVSAYVHTDNNYSGLNKKILQLNFPLKYFFRFLSKAGKNFEMKKIFENFLILISPEILNNSATSGINNNEINKNENSKNNISINNNKNKLNNYNKKITFFLYNISMINSDLNFIPFEILKNLLKSIFYDEELLNLPNLEKYISLIIINFHKLIDDSETHYDNSFIIEQIFSYLNSNTENNFEINNNLKNSKYFFKPFELIFRILNIISDNKNFQLICVNYIFDVIKYINSKNDKIRILATNLFSKLMKIISYLKLDKSYESQIINMKKSLKGINNFNLIKNFVQQKDIKDINGSNNPSEEFFLSIKIKENLRYYQIAGIKWLSTLTSLGLGLALCDDMGLGKTIQTLCCIANETKIYQQKYKKNPLSLIICPNTLILNWIKESKKFFDESEFKLKKFEGKFSNKKNENFKNNISKNETIDNNNQIEVYVTSYDKIRELDEIDEEFFYVILDEAHIIKNPKTKLYQNIKKISSERRIILTGTPIQNNVMELWSLFDFLMPGFLGTENDFEIKFHKKIFTNIKKLNLEEKLQENIFQSSLNDIRKRIKPFILRRLKQDVLKELPDKIIQDYICEMTPVQKELYSYWDNIYSTIGIKEDKNKKNFEKKSSKNTKHQGVLKIIDSMRKICNYPGLLLNNKNDNDKEYYKFIENYIDKINDFNCSGKLKALEDILVSFNFTSINSEIINSNANGVINNTAVCNETNKLSENKILIFSQYRGMLQIIKSFLDFSFKYLNVKILSSDMNEHMRSEVVNNFNSDPNIHILLLTTSIGGLGLSLTAANIVIMYDHDWNPMRDLQAMDRAHRLGQKKTVEVFRLITAESIEEKLISLQTFKKYIANNIVDQSKIHDNNLNMENFMESLEEFSNNKLSHGNLPESDDKKKTRRNLIDSIEEKDEKNRINEEIEFEYLRKLF